jgi:hypothetical protein
VPIRRAGESARDEDGYAPRANQICKIGAAAKNSIFLLSGVATIEQNAPCLRKKPALCGTFDWRSGQAARLHTSFCNFFFCAKKKLTVPFFKRIFTKIQYKNQRKYPLLFLYFYGKINLYYIRKGIF